MTRRRSFLVLVTAALVAAGLLGPRGRVRGSVDSVELPEDLDAYLDAGEARVTGIRPGDEKGIVWNDPAEKARTPLVVVYLHGFSADRHEIDPVPARVAGALGANLYFARLTGHGRNGQAMAEASADDWLRDAEEAMAIGARLADHVVLIGTSTGGTLALWTAAQERWRKRLLALVLVSPNLGPRDPAARVLLWPWGGLIARSIVGRERCFEPANERQGRHWTTCYPTGALVPMMALTEHVRSMAPNLVRVPTLVFYSPDDQVVDAGRVRTFFSGLAAEPKELVPVSGSGDPEHHVLTGDILSPQTNGRVVDDILRFLTPLTR